MGAIRGKRRGLGRRGKAWEGVARRRGLGKFLALTKKAKI